MKNFIDKKQCNCTLSTAVQTITWEKSFRYQMLHAWSKRPTHTWSYHEPAELKNKQTHLLPTNSLIPVCAPLSPSQMHNQVNWVLKPSWVKKKTQKKKKTIFYNIQLAETHPSGSSAKRKGGSSTRAGAREEMFLLSANVLVYSSGLGWSSRAACLNLTRNCQS